MEKVSLMEKQNFIREMNVQIYSSSGVEPIIKRQLEGKLKSTIFSDKIRTKEDLELLEKQILTELKANIKEVVTEVTDVLKNPTVSAINEVNSVNTIKRDDGTTITSAQFSNGSITVKDSTYSGDINGYVSEVAKNNPDMTKTELVNTAFKDMQSRQKDISVNPIYKYDDKTIESVSDIKGDNRNINQEYKILIDERNRLIDLKNNGLSSGNSMSNDQEKKQVNTQAPKGKVLTKSLPGVKFDEAAFIDTVLLGCVTLYTGVLGLCAIFAKM